MTVAVNTEALQAQGRADTRRSLTRCATSSINRFWSMLSK